MNRSIVVQLWSLLLFFIVNSFSGEKKFKIISAASNIKFLQVLSIYNNFRGNYKRTESRQPYILYCSYIHTETLGGKNLNT